MRPPSLRSVLGLVAGVFLFLQVGLIMRNGCDVAQSDNLVQRKEENVDKTKEARRIMSLSRMEFIERSVDEKLDHDRARIYGNPRKTESYLTIGIPSIRRQNVTYLEGTVESLAHQASTQDRKDIVVVVFLSDFDESYKMATAKKLRDRFLKEIEEGFLHIIQAPRSFYPDLNNLERTFNDPENRVKWRSKQNYDYAYLMKYSQPLARYYMQLEDDVVTVTNYLSHIKHYIKGLKSKHWSCLEFSDLGFIGKLFPSEDIGRLAKFLIMFFDQQPVDLLFPYFYRLMTQGKPIVSRPSLFQHMGALSSFNGNKNPLKDRYFMSAKKQLKGDNPSAQLFTSIEAFEDYTIERAYSLEDALGFFWGKTPKIRDTVHIVFQESQSIDKLVVVTGNTEHPGDRLGDGVIEMGETVERVDGKDPTCRNMQEVGKFQEGVAKLKSQVPFKVMCVRITVGQDQKTWLIISEIAVFLRK
ncbi:alpha-1,6-mannosyl-glycoprotein 4-beta-N-acetylglucosaminyltransferase-like isoform X2 [Liolophura sinensis]|uniref:alpha-1,6-mannosyl-glycoprotein 4-beta-N-acetylglucosaminyltransferase-like isoform X2 n=1 Tax=Liolophura sinensis TaxID=3198878 RepID=UPI00315917D8